MEVYFSALHLTVSLLCYLFVQSHGGRNLSYNKYFFWSQDNLVIVHHQASKVISSCFLTFLLLTHHNGQFQLYSQYYYPDSFFHAYICLVFADIYAVWCQVWRRFWWTDHILSTSVSTFATWTSCFWVGLAIHLQIYCSFTVWLFTCIKLPNRHNHVNYFG